MLIFHIVDGEMSGWFITILTICFHVDNFSALLTQHIFLNMNILVFLFQLGNYMENFSRTHPFIRIVNQGKNKFKVFKMPLCGQGDSVL
jgi:hypothetical protein